ncbi:MAG TPA: transcription antitermination factor NusB, partial [Phycisphaerae bacterium]|nr:transcription antitermination factor NusB [Phycisphaerae bacterium]
MLALQALCVYEAVGDAFAPGLNDFLRDELVLEDLEIEQPPPAELLAFARTLVDGAWARRPSYDDLLNRTVTHWRVGRMPPVDRNVLRLGLFELLDQRETAPAI